MVSPNNQLQQNETLAEVNHQNTISSPKANDFADYKSQNSKTTSMMLKDLGDVANDPAQRNFNERQTSFENFEPEIRARNTPSQNQRNSANATNASPLLHQQDFGFASCLDDSHDMRDVTMPYHPRTPEIQSPEEQDMINSSIPSRSGEISKLSAAKDQPSAFIRPLNFSIRKNSSYHSNKEKQEVPNVQLSQGNV